MSIDMNTLSRWWKTYGKAIIATLFAIVTAVQAAVIDQHISQVEGVQILIAGLTAFMVWLAPILPGAPGIKTATAVALAVTNVLATVIVGGISPSDLTEVVLAALTVLGVGKAPAMSTARSTARYR